MAVPSGVKAADGQEGAATVMARLVLGIKYATGPESIQHQWLPGALCDLPLQLFSAAPSNPTNCEVESPKHVDRVAMKRASEVHRGRDVIADPQMSGSWLSSLIGGILQDLKPCQK